MPDVNGIPVINFTQNPLTAFVEGTENSTQNIVFKLNNMKKIGEFYTCDMQVGNKLSYSALKDVYNNFVPAYFSGYQSVSVNHEDGTATILVPFGKIYYDYNRMKLMVHESLVEFDQTGYNYIVESVTITSARFISGYINPSNNPTNNDSSTTMKFYNITIPTINENN